MIARSALAAALALVFPAAFAAADELPAGKYECWHFSTPLPGMAFTIRGGGKYTDIEGKSGSYSYTGGRIAFQGGAFDGQKAIFRAGKPPTIAFVSDRGAETETCQPGS